MADEDVDAESQIDTDSSESPDLLNGVNAENEETPEAAKQRVEIDRSGIDEAGGNARGLPALWSAILGLPFVIWGTIVLIGVPNAPPEIGMPILMFGLFVIVLGVYIHFVAAPPPPTLREDERLLETQRPSQRAAAVKILSGFVLLVAAGYLLFYTFLPYIYFLVPGLIGLYLFATGLYAYWTNTLTTYYVTTHRLVKEYRFISLVRQELPFEKVRGVRERKSIWETIVGIGNVRVASGGGQSLEIVIRNISAPTSFADEIRNMV